MPICPTSVRPVRVALPRNGLGRRRLPAGARRRARLRPCGRMGGRRRARGFRAAGDGRRGRGSVRATRSPAGRGGRRAGHGRRRLVWLSRLPPRRPARAHPARAAPPSALPDFALAFYDHLLRLDCDGQWWFEALWSDARDSALRRRLGLLRDRLRARRAACGRCGWARSRPRRRTPRAPGGGGGLSRADRRGRDLPGQHLPAPRGALVGRPARPVRARARERSRRAMRRWWPGRGARLCSASPELFLRRRGRQC